MDCETSKKVCLQEGKAVGYSSFLWMLQIVISRLYKEVIYGVCSFVTTLQGYANILSSDLSKHVS